MTDHDDADIIPAHPHLRRKPLPWQELKPAEEDPQAKQRVQAILDSPGYRLADQDVDFLNEDDTRGVRLQIDYFKAEQLLEQHGVKHTIVVFGSTRIRESEACKRKIEKILSALKNDPGNEVYERQLTVARRVLDKSHYYDVARDFGQIVGQSGNGPDDNRVVLMTGGGPGIMEAANRGAFDVGAKSVGLNITLPHEQFPNPYVTSNLCFRFHYFAIRKLHFLMRAKALVTFPGGYGTMDELFETLTLIQTREIQPVPVVLVGEHYWRHAFNIDFLADEGVIDEEDRELFWYAESAQEAWQGILTWHERNGTPLFSDTV
ncbi:MAG: LOG family protein [Thioalkalispiraceae bacterium]|jgi:hypothetical protein